MTVCLGMAMENAGVLRCAPSSEKTPKPPNSRSDGRVDDSWNEDTVGNVPHHEPKLPARTSAMPVLGLPSNSRQGSQREDHRPLVPGQQARTQIRHQGTAGAARPGSARCADPSGESQTERRGGEIRAGNHRPAQGHVAPARTTLRQTPARGAAPCWCPRGRGIMASSRARCGTAFWPSVPVRSTGCWPPSGPKRRAAGPIRGARCAGRCRCAPAHRKPVAPAGWNRPQGDRQPTGCPEGERSESNQYRGP